MSITALDEPLVLGPMLRYVDDTSATVWVRTAASARVTVERAGRTWSAATVALHGSHYALVVLDGLLPGSDDTYSVRVGDEPVWPRPGMPPSRIRTLDPSREPYFAFGTCRTTGSHDAQGNKAHGVDALRTLALALRDDPEIAWPDVLLLLGDQVYADTTPNEDLKEFMAARRSLDEPPGVEIKDFVEYAEPLPAGVERGGDPLGAVDRAVGDDLRRPRHPRRLEHLVVVAARDPRDDVVAGAHRLRARVVLAAPAPGQPLAGRAGAGGGVATVVEHEASGATDELDLTATSTRWRPAPTPTRRRTGGATPVRGRQRPGRHRLAGRPRAAPDGRSMLDADELRWVDGVLHGGSPPVHRHLAALPAAPRAARLRGDGRGAGPGRVRAPRPRGRREAAAQHRPRALGRLQRGLRRAVRAGHGGGPRRARAGAADHHLPLRRRAQLLPGRGHRPARLGAQSRVVQAVCSPIRNPMPRGVRMVMSLFAKSLVRPMRFIASQSPDVPSPAYPWTVTDGPWFDNNIALVTVGANDLALDWVTGVVEGDEAHPRLQQVYAVRLDPLPATARVGSGSVQG